MKYGVKAMLNRCDYNEILNRSVDDPSAAML